MYFNLTLKEHQRHNLKGFTFPTIAKWITIFDQKHSFRTYSTTVGYVEHVQFLFIFGLSHRLYKGSKVTVRSEDPGIFVQQVQQWSSGKHFDHGQFEIKIFPIYAAPRPNTYKHVSHFGDGGIEKSHPCKLG